MKLSPRQRPQKRCKEIDGGSRVTRPDDEGAAATLIRPSKRQFYDGEVCWSNNRTYCKLFLFLFTHARTHAHNSTQTSTKNQISSGAQLLDIVERSRNTVTFLRKNQFCFAHVPVIGRSDGDINCLVFVQ